MDDLLADAPFGFFSFSDDGTIRTVNRTLLRMLGYEDDELTGGSVEKMLTVGSRIFYHTHFFPLVRMQGSAEEIFLLLRSADGSDMPVLVNARRREDGDATVTDCGAVRVKERQKFEAELLRARRTAEDALAEVERQRRDLSAANAMLEEQAVELEMTSEELRVRGDELERLREHADDANQAKSNFLAMMSHELRTPLNAIGGYAQLLEMGIQGPVNETQRESLARIEQSQRHLLRLVNEILNLARIESGHVEYDVHDVALDDLVSPVLPLVTPQLQNKQLVLEVDIPHGLQVCVDTEKAQQVLLNLLSNAIKFTGDGGRITLRAAVGAANESTGAAGAAGGTSGDEVGSGSDVVPHVILSVRDTGIGIPPELLDAIFDPFVQVEVSRSRRGEGTGLGLAISRDLMRGMDGDLSVSSQEGRGSTFFMRMRGAETAAA